MLTEPQNSAVNNLLFICRLFVEDGSGSAHMYLSEGELVRNCLCVAQAEWKDLCDLVTDIGHVVYTNRSHYKVTISGDPPRK